MSLAKDGSVAPRELPKAALHHMDLMRGVAALAVLVAHVRGVFLVDTRDVPSPSIGMRGLYLLTGFGHQAVVVFFVLSGFFIGTSVLRSKDRAAWSWEGFLCRRFARLYIVLVPALALTALLDLSGMHLFGTENIYGAKLVAPFITFDDARLTTHFATLLGNLFFLQYMFVEPYGTNGPLWSLGYEFWSYVLFPLLVFGFARYASPKGRATSLLLAVTILIVGALNFVRYFGLWLIGAGVSYVWSRIPSSVRIPRWTTVPALTVFAALLLAARISGGHALAEYAAAAGTAGLLMVLLMREEGEGQSTLGAAYARFAARLAGFSYTLYLVHFPIIAFVSASLGRTTRWTPSVGSLLFSAGLSGAILVVAYVLAQLTERHTDVARAQLEAFVAWAHGRRDSRSAKGA